jgi:hypothetical protein
VQHHAGERESDNNGPERQPHAAVAGKQTYKPECIEQMRELAEAGMRDEEIAAHLGVHRWTLHRWQVAHPELFAARERKHAIARELAGRPPFVTERVSEVGKFLGTWPKPAVPAGSLCWRFSGCRVLVV